MQLSIQQPQTMTGEGLIKGNVKFIMSPEPIITLRTSQHRETSTDIEIRNECKEWVIYQLRSNSPQTFLLKPCSKGVLAPNDLQPLQLILLPGHSQTANYQLLLEATKVPQINNRKRINATLHLRLARKENISQSIVS